MSFVVSAVSAAIELGTVAAIATAVTEVGIAMTVVGTVTGAKELTKIGGFLSLAGGATGLAAGAGLFGAAAGDAATGAATSTAADAGVSSGADQALNQGLTNQATGTLATDTASTVADAPTAYSITTPTADVHALGDVNTNFANPGAATTPTGVAANAADGSSAAGANVDGAATATNSGSTVSGVGGNADGAITGTSSVTAPSTGQSISNWYNGLSKDAQSHVNTALLQAGGSAVGGLFNGWSAEQKLALQQQAQNLQTQAYNTSVTNANSVPTISFKPVGIVTKAQGS